MEDCGCGGGKKNCITKRMVKKIAKKYPNMAKGIQLYNFVKSELKKLDCGCGCKGEKKFCEKYELKGGKLNDCPEGWRTDPLTCVKNCPDGYRDDGITCVKNCPEGWISDPLTCRKPITSSMNECPEGSRDIAGTCWGPVRRDCIDDCFKHPAPGCRTWECGRLHWAGVDWGPKLCTDCNLRCGQTCWDVQGITKQLHQRDLKVQGGEVIGRQILGKEIRGRVDLGATFKEMMELFKDIFEGIGEGIGTGDWSKAKYRLEQIGNALDPEKNGVAEAFRKFGAMTQKAFEEIGNNIAEGFKKFGEEMKGHLEKFAKMIEDGYNQVVPDWIKDKLKDPDFWIDFSIVLLNVAATVGGIAASVVTLGAAGPAVAAGLMLLTAAGPAIKMGADAARGRPVDGLDIAAIAFALIPGVGPTASAASKGITTALNVGMKGMQALSHVNKVVQLGKFVVAGVKVGQAFGVIPHTYIANAPAGFNADVPPPPDPLEDDYIKYAKKNVPCYPGHPGTENLWRPIDNPARCDYNPPGDWVAQQLALPPAQRQDLTKPYNPSSEIPPIPPSGEQQPEKDEFGPPPGDEFGPPPSDEFGPPPSDEFDIPPTFEDEFGIPPTFEGAAKIIRRGGANDNKSFSQMVNEYDTGIINAPLLTPEQAMKEFSNQPEQKVVETSPGVFSNPFDDTHPKVYKDDTYIPKTHTGAEFNVDCYARKNPDLAASVGNDKQKLLSHWIEIGSKKAWDADCGPAVSEEERAKLMNQLQIDEIKKKVCNAADSFWVESEKRCDSYRHADGRDNTAAAKCAKSNSLFQKHQSDRIGTCIEEKNPDGTDKTAKDKCLALDNYWNKEKNVCEYDKNVDGTLKTRAEYCNEILGSYWDEEKQECDTRYSKDKKKHYNAPLMNDRIAPYAPRSYQQDYIKCKESNTWNQTEINRLKAVLKDAEEKYDKLKNRPEYSMNDYLRGQRDHQLAIIKDATEKLAKYGKDTDCTFILKIPTMLETDNFFKANEAKFKEIEKNRNDIKPVGSGLGSKSITLYYANWCGHCKTMMPEWNKLKNKYKDIMIRKVESKDNNELEVSGYPTIIYRNGSNEEKYQGERTLKAFKQFMDLKLKK